MELLTFTFAAGETKRFERAGRYIELIDASYAIDMFLYDTAGARVDEARGALSGIYLTQAYGAVEMRSASAQTITLLVSAAGGGSRRQPGNVRVIDQSFDKTRAGLQFMNSIGQAVDAVKLSIAGVFNPLANPRSVSIKRVVVSSATAGLMYFIKGTGGTGTAFGNNQTAGNKLVTGAVSTALVFGGNTAALTPTVAEVPGRYLWVAFYVPANTAFLFPLDAPVVLSPNDQFLVSGGVANRDVSAVFDFEEIQT